MDDRLDKIEATQHFMLAWIAALASTHQDKQALGQALRVSLENHMAVLLAESGSDVKIQALQELVDQALGKSDLCTFSTGRCASAWSASFHVQMV